MRALDVLLAYLRALWTLLVEATTGGLPLGRARLVVKTRVDKKQLHSTKGQQLTAFVDGSVLESGACGLSVYYGERHYLNSHGGFDAGSAPANSNLAELAALFWALLHHPRGQELAIVSDSAHALRVVAAASSEVDVPRAVAKRHRKAQAAGAAPPTNGCPALEVRERCLARAIWWLLRLRTAATKFHKVPGHKEFKDNQVADALAGQGAKDYWNDGKKDGPKCELPLRCSAWRLPALLLRFLLDQCEMDGGLAEGYSGPVDGGGAAPRRRDGGRIVKPEPTGTSTELTRVVALDCEMVGVGAFGGESRLASVVVVNEQGNQVYFSYARPPKHVTDYRTKWSGVTREMLADAPPAAQVQEEVKNLVKGRLVVGHGLENDFRVLGFFPPRETLRDTAHDLPRLQTRGGRPRKLRRIAWEFLGLTIQDSESGHDPLEDARAALLLYRRFRENFEAVAAQQAAEAEARRAVAATKKDD